jgi:predicted PhzF superfamily epimerase YddE/YHI9
VIDLHVLRVFIGPDGRGGNPLGVFVDGAAIEPERRQATAAELGFSETVFVDAIDPSTGIAVVRIFTPAVELPFAGHPTVGTSWLLAFLGHAVATLRCPAGDVRTWTDDDGRRWIRARPEWVHTFAAMQLASAAEVDAEAPGAMGEPGRYVWAWEDEATGRLRSRYFPTDFGIREDEATGAAAVRMGGMLGRPLVIRQGKGSELLVRPDPAAGTVDVGGRVELVEVRAFNPTR